VSRRERRRAAWVNRRTCTRKVGHENKELADAAAESLRIKQSLERKPKKVDVYQCPVCNLWHVGKVYMKIQRKIIFLDCDGVINSHGTFVSHKGSTNMDTWPIDKSLLANLQKIIEATGAEIVISSAWRRHTKAFGRIRSACRRWGKVIGKTPRMDDKDRYVEILQWFEDEGVNLAEVTYAVIDDDPGAGGPHPFFQTKMKFGLTVEIADKVIEHLGLKNAEADPS
jgi:hypothetical protein